MTGPGDHGNDRHTAISPDAATRLATAAREAEQLRLLATRPDVVALRVDRLRRQVDGLLWLGITLGLAFTAVNVQRFAAGGAPAYSATWWAAWLLDPMVSLVLLAVLRAEQLTARYQVRLAGWARGTKWATCAATYTMNTWEAWGLADVPLSPSGVVLHSIPPLLVVLAAETGPGLRDRLAEAARRASVDEAAFSESDSPQPSTPDVHDRRVRDIHEHSEPQVRDMNEPGAREAPGARRREPRRRGSRTSRRQSSRGRRLLADYVADARSALAEASDQGPIPIVTPTWCRKVTGCSAGTSVKVAAALRAGTPP